jgi:hypothetical protein
VTQPALEQAAPGRPGYSWPAVALIVAAVLVAGFTAGTYVFFIPLIVGIVMLFGGPLYAGYFVPTMIARWRRAAQSADDSEVFTQDGSPGRRYILHFGTTNQRMTLMLNVVLIVNLVSFGLYKLITALKPSSDDVLVTPVVYLGIIAVVAGIPLIVLNLRWRLNTETVPVEALALRRRLGSWRLIRAARILSLMVWCGYPAASIVIIAVGVTFG